MEQYCTVTEAAKLLAVSRPTIYAMLERGELEYIKVTLKVTRIKRASVIRILEGANNEPNSPTA